MATVAGYISVTFSDNLYIINVQSSAVMNMRWSHLAVVLLLSVLLCVAFHFAGTASAVEFGTEVGSEIIVDIKLDASTDENWTQIFQGSSVTFDIDIKNMNDTNEDNSYKISTKLLDEKTGLGLSLNTTTTETLEKSEWAFVSLTISSSSSTPLESFLVQVSVNSTANETIYTTGRITIQVLDQPDYDVAISAESPTALTIKEGGEGTIEILIENLADATDDIHFEYEINDETVLGVIFPDLVSYFTLTADETKEISLDLLGLAPGTATITLTVTSINDGGVDDDVMFTVTVTAVKDDSEEEKSFLEQDIAGIPLVALFVVIIVVPVVAVVAIGKKKKKGAAQAVPAQPGMTPGMPAQPGMPGQAMGVPQPMVMHCPNCGGVIEVANPAMPQPVQCTHCGSAFQFPGTGQQQAPPQAPAQPQYGAQPGYGAPAPQAAYQTTPCPACGTPIPVPPQRPVTIACPGCASQYNLN